ncbi:hypothetical protein E1265_06810 [Streptomyces sp. 8K308]|nr:hypothetical protein E1265_06810 [Streptomyces sp. 8K308]
MRTGDPNGTDSPPWPRFGTTDSPDGALSLTPDDTETIDLSTAHNCDLWDTPRSG